MARFILRRLSYNVLVLIGVLFFVHGLLLATGDPAASLLPIDAGAEALETVREKHGLNDPVPVQFVKFVGRVAQGDFGDSWQHSRPALDLILERAPASLKLGLVGLGIALVVGTPLGALAALRKGTWIDQSA
jgi:peptide/nickel transport system permease protein